MGVRVREWKSDERMWESESVIVRIKSEIVFENESGRVRVGQ